MDLIRQLVEIHRLKAEEFPAGRAWLDDNSYSYDSKKLKWHPYPGSQTEWAIATNKGAPDVLLAHERKVIGHLQLTELKKISWPERAYDILTVTVDEKYKGKGLAPVMYYIALTKLGPLLLGSQHTPGGAKLALSISKVPGIKVRGFLILRKSSFHPEERAERKLEIEEELRASKARIIGQTSDGADVWSFAVKPGTVELEAVPGIDLYDLSISHEDLGVYATWVGGPPGI